MIHPSLNMCVTVNIYKVMHFFLHHLPQVRVLLCVLTLYTKLDEIKAGAK